MFEGKEAALIIWIYLLKKRRRKVKIDPKLGGQWKKKEKVFCLVSNGRRRRRFFAWWPMEGEGKSSLLGGQWKEKDKVLCLVANGRRRRRFFATSSHFPPKQLHLDLHFFSFNIKVLLYHGPRPLFTHSFPFPWPINYDRIFWCYKSPPPSLSIWFCWRFFLSSLKLWCRTLSHLTGPKPHKRMKNRLWNHL